MDNELTQLEKEHEATLKALNDAYQKRIEKRIAVIFRERILPWLQANPQFYFRAGNGTYLIAYTGTNRHVEPPAKIRRLLEWEVLNGNGYYQWIGSLMPDYN